ncbi:MAG: hypothetical protein ACOWWR_18495 [Eubacteriales bacterium]
MAQNIDRDRDFRPAVKDILQQIMKIQIKLENVGNGIEELKKRKTEKVYELRKNKQKKPDKKVK